MTKPNLTKATLPALLTLALLLAACGAPAGTTPPPPPVAASAPVQGTPGSGEAAKIAVYTYYQSHAFDGTLKRLNDQLMSSGQSVAFDVVYVPYVQGEGNVIRSSMQKDLASGTPACDAYSIDISSASAFADKGLTMDPTDLMGQYAPVFCAKYNTLFPQKLTGIPTGIVSKPLWLGTAVMLDNSLDAEGSGITDTDSFFAYLDSQIVTPAKQYTVIADPMKILDVWTMERGYYDLSTFNVDGYLYAAMDDPACKPVPLESIPGLDKFLIKLKGYYKNGALTYSYGQTLARQIIGSVGSPTDYYVLSINSWRSPAGGASTAHVFNSSLPAFFNDPLYLDELVLPAACPAEKAADVIKFVEWLYSGQQNYDSVIYGQEKVDFNIVNGRISPLADGKPLKTFTFSGYTSLFSAWPGASALVNLDFCRLSSAAPDNLEALMQAGLQDGRRLPANTVIGLNRENILKMSNTDDEMKAECAARDDALGSLVYSDPIGFGKAAVDQCMGELAKVNTSRLVSRYEGMIKALGTSSAG